VYPGRVGEVQCFVTAVAVRWCRIKPIKIQPWFLVLDLYCVLLRSSESPYGTSTPHSLALSSSCSSCYVLYKHFKIGAVNLCWTCS